MPQQRKLPERVRAEAAHLLRFKANKKLVQQHVMRKTGKQIILKDLSKIALTSQHGIRIDLPTCVKTLKDSYDRLKEKTSYNEYKFSKSTLKDVSLIFYHLSRCEACYSFGR